MNEEWTLDLLEEAVAKESGSWLEHVPVNVIRALVAKERERCAQIAENPDKWAYPEGRSKWTADVIAKRIRGDVS